MFQITYLAPIDPHVHLRGDEYSHVKPSFLELGLLDAIDVKLAALIEQPNPNPWLTTLERIDSRMAQVAEYLDETKSPMRHKIHIGLTTDTKQVKQALVNVMRGDFGLASDKTFYSGTSNTEADSGAVLAIKDHKLSKWAWETKARLGYMGVSEGHMEDEDFFDKSTPFNPDNPITHSLYQTEEAETVQAERQLQFAYDAGFRGTFYVVHASSPDTIDLLNRWRQKTLLFKIIIETTGHHMFLNTETYKIHGNRVKMNPPLRSPQSQAAVLDRVLRGQTHIIGTDHAPHPLEAKDSDNPPSGIPELLAWPLIVKKLRDLGLQEKDVERLTFHTGNRLFFKQSLSPREVTVEYNPERWIERYGYNPLSTLEDTL